MATTNNHKDADKHMEIDLANGEDYTIEWPEERIDIIGQNGNDGEHYGMKDDSFVEVCFSYTFENSNYEDSWFISKKLMKGCTSKAMEDIVQLRFEDMERNFLSRLWRAYKEGY